MNKRFLTGWSILLGILMVALGLGLQATPVQAQSTSQEAEEPTCVTCHENLYYQHDTGNHYCLTAARSRCADCHGGDPTALVKDAAHLGRTAHPVINGDFSRCQACHPTDAAAHVAKFASLSGISPTVIMASQAPAVSASVPAEPSVGNRDVIVASSILGLTVAGLMLLCFLTNRSCHG